MNTLEKQNKKEKLPFAIFVSPRNLDGKIADYKQVFTDIISDRIKQKYK